jgi:tRNA 2-selenouridine synthase
VENESRTIGRVFIPELFWDKMCAASLIHIDVSLQERVQKLVDIYACDQDKQSLIASFQKIDTRLGGQHVKAALEALEQNDYHRAAEIALTYYDKTYYYGLEQSKERIISTIDASNMPVDTLSQHLITQAQHVFQEPEVK